MKIKHKTGALISRIHQMSHQIFKMKMKEHHISIYPTQGRIMFALWEKNGLSVQDLLHHTKLNKSSLSLTLKRMEKLGLIKVEPLPNNHREKQVFVLVQKQEVETGYEQLSDEMNSLTFTGFTPMEIDQLESYLERVLRNLELFSEQNHPQGGKKNEESL
jgi:DNA-binding MarR family transcriptional regulator